MTNGGDEAAGGSVVIDGRPINDVANRGVKPGKVQAIAIMMLVGGILAILTGIGLILGTFCLWVPAFYSLVMGILAVIKASKLLGDGAANEAPPKTIAILQIINVINFDIVNLVMGILTLVFLSEPEVSGYFNPEVPG